MFTLRYDEIIARIKEEKKLTDEDIDQRIKDKLRQLSDLISKEGAAHIVANELGVRVVAVSREVKVSQLLHGMASVTLTGKVVKINEVITFTKNGKEGRVLSFLLGDETGTVRCVFWDAHHIHEVEQGTITEGTLLKIKNAYVRTNNGFKEVHLGNKGELEINPPGIEIQVSSAPSFDFTRKKIIELMEGDTNIGIFGTIVQLFEPRFYEACSQCGKKIEIIGESKQCREHGSVSGESVPILNLSFDDGTDNLRAVAFRTQVEYLLGLSREQILEMKDNPNLFEDIRQKILGKQLILIGRTTKNELFNRKELTIQRVVEVKPEEILQELQR